HEAVFSRKSKIYEFPREFNRLRQNVIAFLVQTFRPSPLEPTPVNRGFYFSGTREIESLPSAPDTSTNIEMTRAPQQSLDATYVFRGDPAEVSKGSSADADLNVTRVRRGGMQTHWVFLNGLFKEVIHEDRSFESFPVVSAPASE